VLFAGGVLLSARDGGRPIGGLLARRVCVRGGRNDQAGVVAGGAGEWVVAEEICGGGPASFCCLCHRPTACVWGRVDEP
jgi:hypothetical protein